MGAVRDFSFGFNGRKEAQESQRKTIPSCAFCASLRLFHWWELLKIHSNREGREEREGLKTKLHYIIQYIGGSKINRGGC
jgi:hypothetical protein